jgi:thiol-disulfide isomerase/thioredoxin
MKKISFLLLILITGLTACKTTKPVAETLPAKLSETVPVRETAPAAFNFSEQSSWILGYFNIERLKQSPYSEWYLQGYDEYSFNTEAVNKLQDISKDNLTMKIVVGTWCPDSRREVPRFMRIIDLWQFPVSKITFIGVDNAKLSPVGEYDKLDIQRVPTFIIYKNNIEAGRIIENPKTSLEQDIVNILSRNE